MLFISMPNSKTREGKALIISNTCDMHKDNNRISKKQILYAPIIVLDKYRHRISQGNYKQAQIIDHINSIKRQELTNVFYLPSYAGILEESVVLLDRIINCNPSYITSNKLKEKRLFSLNNYAFYLLIFKLSMHFSRIRENIDRN